MLKFWIFDPDSNIVLEAVKVCIINSHFKQKDKCQKKKVKTNMNSLKNKQKKAPKAERKWEVPVYHGIHFRSIEGALWRLWTVNNSFIIPTQEKQPSRGKSWGAEKAINVLSGMIYLWRYQYGNAWKARSFFCNKSKVCSEVKLEFSKIKVAGRKNFHESRIVSLTSTNFQN